MKTACSALCPNATKLHRKSGPLLLSPLFHEDGQILIFPAPPAGASSIPAFATCACTYIESVPVQFGFDFRLKPDKKKAAPKLERPLQSRTISIRRSLGMDRLQHKRLPLPHWRATDAIVVKAGCLSM